MLYVPGMGRWILRLWIGAEAVGCPHYNGPLDVVRNRCATCGHYWECYLCHAEVSDHPFGKMPVDAPFSTQCGACAGFMPYGHERCLHCGQGFNPGCSMHAAIYYDL